jgi:hypothetical protein
VELSLTWISMDPLGFRVRWCGVGYISFDLHVLSLPMVVILVRWSCWNLVVGFSPWPNTNSEILLAHSCLAGDGTKV